MYAYLPFRHRNFGANPAQDPRSTDSNSGGSNNAVIMGGFTDWSNLSTFTCSFWIKDMAAVSGTFGYFSRYQSNGNKIMVLRAAATASTCRIYFYIGTKLAYVTTSGWSNTWKHYCFVFNAGTVNAYVNGVATAWSFSNIFDPTTPNITSTGTSSLHAYGANPSGLLGEVPSRIYQFAAWNTNLTKTQIGNIYNQVSLPTGESPGNLVSYWDSSNSGSIFPNIIDVGSGGNDGTLSNGNVYNPDVP